MRYKFFTLFTALTLSAGALFASDTAVDGIYYDFDDAKLTATVTYRGRAYNSYADEYTGDVVIPATVNYDGKTYSVTSIGNGAFEYCSGLTSVTIPNSVTSIGSWAFKYCSSLTSVVWNAKNCADFAKYYDRYEAKYYYGPFGNIASQITSFTFGSEVEHIPAYLCYGMENLTSVTIPNSVTSIGSSVFNGCSGLTSVVWNAKNYADFSSSSNTPFIASQITSFTFGSEVEHIPAYLCYGMENLTSVTIPNSVTSIGDEAFYNCSGLTSITIGNSVTNIGDEAFYKCSSLTSVVWNAKNFADFSSIGYAPFYDIKSQITSFTFGSEVEHIPAYLCSYMKNLTSITIPNSVTSIGYRVFEYCSGLTSVTIGNSVTSIAHSAFAYCSGLTSVTIPNSVTSIGSAAFFRCSGLTSVTIGNSVTSIGKNAFYECSGLTSVVWDAKNCADFAKYYDEFNGTYYYGPFYEIASQITSFTFGSEVEHIPAYLCIFMNNLTSVTIPNSVTSIGDDAFCVCRGLTSVTIPNSVTSIGDYAFEGCTALHEITALPTVPPTCGSNAFYNVPTGATLRCPCASREDYQAADTWSQFTNIIPADFPNVTLLADEEQGSVQVEDRICESKSVVISATANAGYHFVQWSNGATDATYTFILTQDTILTAEFALNQHKVTVTAGENGSVKVVLNDEETAETTFAYGTEIIITATADEGYCFVQWDDDNIDNPRTITVTEDITLSAEFAPSQTALETVTLSPVYAVDGRIVCNDEFRIYDLLGRDVTRLNGSLCGVYVVKTANAAVKVVVR